MGRTSAKRSPRSAPTTTVTPAAENALLLEATGLLGRWQVNGIATAVAHDGTRITARVQCPHAFAVHLEEGCDSCQGRLDYALAAANVPDAEYGPDGGGWIGFHTGHTWDVWDLSGQLAPTQPGMVMWNAPRLTLALFTLAAIVRAQSLRPCAATRAGRRALIRLAAVPLPGQPGLQLARRHFPAAPDAVRRQALCPGPPHDGAGVDLRSNGGVRRTHEVAGHGPVRCRYGVAHLST